MNIQELLGEAFKEGMSIDEINEALAGKNFVDPSTLPPSVPKATFDKTASELAKANKTIGELKSANLTDEEKVKKALEDAKIAEDNFLRKSIRLDVKEVLVEAGLKEEDYKDIIDGLVSSDAEASVAMAKNLVSMLASQRQATENAVKKELQGALGKPPKGNENNSITKEDFLKMTLTEKIKFKEENPEQYKEFIGGI